MAPTEAFALYQLHKLSASEIVRIADQWLSEGIFTDSLNELCFITNAQMSEVSPVFEKARKELNTPSFSLLEAAKIVTLETLHRVVSKALAPDAGALFLYREIYHSVAKKIPNKDCVGDNIGLEILFFWLRELCDCRDGSRLVYYSELPRSEAEIKFLQHIFEEAVRYLASVDNVKISYA